MKICLLSKICTTQSCLIVPCTGFGSDLDLQACDSRLQSRPPSAFYFNPALWISLARVTFPVLSLLIGGLRDLAGKDGATTAADVGTEVSVGSMASRGRFKRPHPGMTYTIRKGIRYIRRCLEKERERTGCRT